MYTVFYYAGSFARSSEARKPSGFLYTARQLLCSGFALTSIAETRQTDYDLSILILRAIGFIKINAEEFKAPCQHFNNDLINDIG